MYYTGPTTGTESSWSVWVMVVMGMIIRIMIIVIIQTVSRKTAVWTPYGSLRVRTYFIRNI